MCKSFTTCPCGHKQKVQDASCRMASSVKYFMMNGNQSHQSSAARSRSRIRIATNSCIDYHDIYLVLKLRTGHSWKTIRAFALTGKAVKLGNHNYFEVAQNGKKYWKIRLVLFRLNTSKWNSFHFLFTVNALKSQSILLLIVASIECSVSSTLYCSCSLQLKQI